MIEVVSLVVGAILPPFVDLLTRKVANSKLRFAISMVVCVLVGFAINYQKFNPEEILESLALVFTAAQTVYHTYWKDAPQRSEANK